MRGVGAGGSLIVAALVVLAMAVPASGAALQQPPKLDGAPTCGPSTAGAQPSNGASFPPQAPGYFAAGFPAIRDSRLGVPIGGVGGLRRGARLGRTPVVFVHGNQADGQNWLAVMLQFQRLAGYGMQDMYALSYNGLGNFYAGAPAQRPTQPDLDYVLQNPQALANGGHGAADDDEVPDLCRFIEAVQSYTGSPQVDIVAHSLGVTIARKTMLDYPWIAKRVAAFVGIAGANHGTTVCRGLESSYYGCNEIAPGTQWLAELNGPDGTRETYAPTTWMTIYDGSLGDPFFDPPDEGSPVLRGADNRTFPGAYHNDLRTDPAEVDTYLPFLLVHGQRGPGAARDEALAARIAHDQPDGRTGEICGIPKLTGAVSECTHAFS